MVVGQIDKIRSLYSTLIPVFEYIPRLSVDDAASHVPLFYMILWLLLSAS